MTAKRETVLAALFTAIQGTAVAGLTFSRNPNVEPDDGALPVVQQLDGGQSLESEGQGIKIYRARPIIVGAVRAATAAAVGPALDELYSEVVRVLEADKTLGGVALATFEGDLATEIDSETGHRPIGAFALPLEVLFATTTTDPDV